MNALLVDTSTSLEIVASLKSDVVSQATTKSPASHAHTLFTTIDDALKKNSLTMEELHLLICGIGPGSFTGIRIAVTTMRMLSQVNNIPLAPLASTDIFALPLKDEFDSVIVAFDAKKQRVFGALYSWIDGKKINIIQPGDYPMEHLLGGITNGSVAAVGDGIEKYEELVRASGENITILKDYRPDVEKILIDEIVMEELAEKGTMALSVVPDYQRLSDAEIARNKRATPASS